MLMAGVFAWCVPVIAAASLACLVVALAQSDASSDAAPPVLWAALGTTVWTGLQLVPIGTTLITRLSADRAAPLRLIAAALGTDVPASATAITFDPASTKLEVMKGCCLLCTFVACYLLAQRGHGRFLLGAIAASGAVMALVALGHAAVGAESVFGIYRWKQAAPHLPAPILNSNCLSGFMVLTAPVALALAASTPDARERLAYSLAAFTTAAVGVLAGSRGGTAAMAFALLFSVLVIRIRPTLRHERWQQASVAGLVVAGAVAVAVVVGAEPLFKSLNSGGYSKFSDVARAFGVAFDHRWLGVGRGAFSVAASPSISSVGRFVHAENFLATWTSEWGIPVACALLAVVALGLGRLCLDRSLTRAGAGIALVAFGAQNFLDLGLELLGIATVAAATLGAALGDAAPATDNDVASTRLNLRTVARSVALVTALSLVAFARGAFADGDDAFESRLRAHRTAGARADFREELGSAIAAHPFEPFLFMLAAQEAVDHRDRSAFRWLNLAMLRAPEWSDPHAEAARLLLALGHTKQAALEAGQAGKRHIGVGAAVSCAIARVDSSAELVTIAAARLPAGPMTHAYYSHVIPCLGAQQAREIDLLLLKNNQAGAATVLREHRRLVAEGNAAGARLLLQRASHTPKADERIVLAYVQALVGAKELDQATAELKRARSVGVPKADVARIEAEIATQRGDATGMRAAIDALRAEGAASAMRLAEAASLLATHEERLGNLPAAEAALDDAAMLDSTVHSQRRVLALALRTGKLGKAVGARSKLCALSPKEPECRGRPR